jgi:hypothetical protein
MLKEIIEFIEDSKQEAVPGGLALGFDPTVTLAGRQNVGTFQRHLQSAKTFQCGWG